MDVDAPPSITPDATVVVSEVLVEDEQGYFESLRDIDPLSATFDDDYGITGSCFLHVVQTVSGITW